MAAQGGNPASRWSSAGLMLCLTAAAATAASTGYSVPSYLRICSRHDPALNACLKDSISTLLRHLAGGSQELDVPPLDPLSIPLLEFDLGQDNVNIKLLMKNVNLMGLSLMNILSVKSLVEDHKLEVTSKIPLLDFRGEYTSQGRVVDFPVYSSGSFFVNMSDVTAMWFIYLQHTSLNVSRNLVVENFGLDVIPSSIGYHFGGALDGDNDLGEVTNVFLNENSNEIFNDMKPKIMTALSEIFMMIANQILMKHITPCSRSDSKLNDCAFTKGNTAIPFLTKASYIKQCSRSDPDFNGCVLRNGNEAIPSLVKGDPKLHLQPLDPLKVEHVKVEQGEGPVGITLILNDALVYGLRNAEIKGANFDLAKRVLSADISVKGTDLQVISKYDITGKVLLLPIKGSGDMNLTLDNLSGTYKTGFDLYKKDDGLEYVKLTDSEFTFDIARAYFNFQNLFNGDKALGDTTNEFLNENWQELYKEIKPVVNEVVRSIISKILSELVSVVSYNDIFPQ